LCEFPNVLFRHKPTEDRVNNHGYSDAESVVLCQSLFGKSAINGLRTEADYKKLQSLINDDKIDDLSAKHVFRVNEMAIVLYDDLEVCRLASLSLNHYNSCIFTSFRVAKMN
jgi:hypothetical protein